MKKKIKNYNKGVSLLFTILIMAIVLAISLGISTILFQEIKISRDIGNSIVAFYAADTGIEETNMNRENPQSMDDYKCPFSSYPDICYKVEVIPGADCQADNFCLQSVGLYQKTKRAIEFQY